MRVIQGAILVALVAIGGLLYSIRKEMTEPLAPLVETEQTVPAPQGPATEELVGVQPAVAQPAVTGAVTRAVTRAVAPAPAQRAPARRRTATAAPRWPVLSPAPVAAPPEPYPDPYPERELAPAPVFRPPLAGVAQPLPPPPPLATRVVTVPAGTVVRIRLVDGVSTKRNRPGDTFQATLEDPLVAEGLVVVEQGANVFGRLVHTQQSGRVSGRAEMALELDRLQTVGGEVRIASDTMIRQADSSKGKDAVKVGVMAGIGAAIGAIAGGRKGAGVGAAAGGAAGTGTVLASRGKPVEFPPESRLTFRLRAPITVTLAADRARPAGYEGRPRLKRRF